LSQGRRVDADTRLERMGSCRAVKGRSAAAWQLLNYTDRAEALKAFWFSDKRRCIQPKSLEDEPGYDARGADTGYTELSV